VVAESVDPPSFWIVTIPFSTPIWLNELPELLPPATELLESWTDANAGALARIPLTTPSVAMVLRNCMFLLIVLATVDEKVSRYTTYSWHSL